MTQLSTGFVTLGVGPTLIVPARVGRKELRLIPSTSPAPTIGDSTLNSTNGFPVGASGLVLLDMEGEVYGKSGYMSYLEIY